MDEHLATSQRVRFEEVTPANEPAAFLNVDLTDLVAPLKLPIYDGYDGLDDMRFAFLTLPSGETVMLGAYLSCPEPGTDLYVDKQTQWQNFAQIVFEACQYLNLGRSNVAWCHPDFQTEIDELYANNPSKPQRQISSQFERFLRSQIKRFSQPKRPEPIDAFNHALKIYDRINFPKYWAMLQRNLGLAYYNRIDGDRRENLERSIVCFKSSLKIHTPEEFLDQYEIGRQDLLSAKELLTLIDIDRKSNLVRETIARQIKDKNLQFAKLRYANLSDANLRAANLSGVNLSDADLRGANLMGAANLSDADLRGANLMDANLRAANLSGVNLSDADLRSADLRGANLMGANLMGANLMGANLSDANLSGVNLSDADLMGADLRGANLMGANLMGANLMGANLMGANLSGVNLSDADLMGANLSDADLSYADLMGVNLISANIKNTRFGFNTGISESMRQDLIERGAIFEDLPGDRSKSRTLIPR
jgi:uncharacterized protein YjbI with pentapeptide repeats